VNQLDFKGRAAIVTGGAQGIGLAIVKRLVASGAKVRIWDVDDRLLAKTIAALGSAVTGDSIDVSNAAAVERGVKSALEAMRKIDVFVNNAGIAGATRPVAEYAVEEWERVIRIDLTGPFLCCRAVAPHMVKTGYAAS